VAVWFSSVVAKNSVLVLVTDNSLVEIQRRLLKVLDSAVLID
jgi:hypothetical protein